MLTEKSPEILNYRGPALPTDQYVPTLWEYVRDVIVGVSIIAMVIASFWISSRR